ncbi:Avirulence (Avh) protein [Phytophthora megakarya]|uniref:RxLR effector protein n=1 Tax=Phytophthora megakarya TaxID=4795 RepID=A0A225WVP8_9STRA|nr:Avirulence (Avh) protein [Phytophthora megakarya]
MRIQITKYYVVVVCTIALASATDAFLTPVQAAMTGSSSPTTTEIRPNRLLRTDKAESKGEERASTSLTTMKTWFATLLTKPTVTDVEKKQFRLWLKQKQTPEDVLKLLKMDDDFETILKSPTYNTVVNFITAYNEKVTVKHPEKTVTALGLFVKTYGDEAMAKSLELAKRDPSLEQLAQRIQGDLLAGWAGNGLTTDHVYKILKVKEEEVKDLFTTPAFNVWANFDNMVNHYHPDREKNVLNRLIESFGEIPLAKTIELASKEEAMDDIVYKLQQPLFEKWLREKKTPNEIGNRLKLDRFTWAYDPSEDILKVYGKFYANKVGFGRMKLVKPLITE